MTKIITRCIATILISTLAVFTDNTGQSHDAPATLVSEQNYETLDIPVSEQNYDAGAPVIEKCYDDPNNPVAKQDYSVGEPNIE
ncbi:MAG: hypothetical protein HDR30_08645 [Lachnospiraceae bacterium]|nr:hypothetical protein [Lachnospiraceae bacterium]